MRGKHSNAGTPEDAGLAVALVVFGSVLVGLLTYILWRGPGDVVWVFWVSAVPVALSLAWLWSRMR
jgi:hypothetical protein